MGGTKGKHPGESIQVPAFSLFPTTSLTTGIQNTAATCKLDLLKATGEVHLELRN